MSQKKGSKGLNPVALAIAEEKRKQEQRPIAFSPFMLPAGRMPWAGRRKP